MNTSDSSFTEEEIWPFSTHVIGIKSSHIPFIFTTGNLIGVTYIHLSLIEPPVHNIPDAPTKRYLFYKTITQRPKGTENLRLRIRRVRGDFHTGSKKKDDSNYAPESLGCYKIVPRQRSKGFNHSGKGIREV